MSRFDLYHSTRDEHKMYVRSILECNVTHPGGQLDMLKRYIERTMTQEQQEDKLLMKAAAEQSQQNPSPLPMIVPDPSSPL